MQCPSCGSYATKIQRPGLTRAGIYFFPVGAFLSIMGIFNITMLLIDGPADGTPLNPGHFVFGLIFVAVGPGPLLFMLLRKPDPSLLECDNL